MEEQHGFCPGRSTLSCNLVFTSSVFNAFKNNVQLDVIFTNFKKALDLVNHDTLIKILIASGFGEPLVSWIIIIYNPHCPSVLKKKDVIIGGS